MAAISKESHRSFGEGWFILVSSSLAPTVLMGAGCQRLICGRDGSHSPSALNCRFTIKVIDDLLG
jgi:hypothetical protein